MTSKTHLKFFALAAILLMLFTSRCSGPGEKYNFATAPAGPVTTLEPAPLPGGAEPTQASGSPTPTTSLFAGSVVNAPLAPRVAGQKPDYLEEAPLNSTFDIYFDQPMDAGATASAFTVSGPDSEPVKGKISWPEARLLRFTPDQPLQASSTYQVKIDKTARSASGKAPDDVLTVTFNTVGKLAVSQVSPADGTSDIASQSIITVIFNRPVVPLVISEDTSTLPDPLQITPTLPGKGEWLNTSVYVYRPDQALVGATQYHARVKAGLADLSGVKLEQDYAWSFLTIAPSVESFNLPGLMSGPPNYLSDVPLNQTFEINFRQPMQEASVQDNFSLVEGSTGKSVAGRFVWNETDTQVVFSPLALLKLGSNYELIITKKAQAKLGGGLGDGLDWNFNTVLPPAVTSIYPNDGTVQRDFSDSLTIFFASPMKPSTMKDKVQLTPQPAKGAGQFVYSDRSIMFFGLKPSTSYTVTVLPGMTDVYGNAITRTYVFTFQTASVAPSAYLMMPWSPSLFRVGGAQQFYVNSVNVKKLNFELYKMTPADMASLMQGGVAWSNYNPVQPAVRKWSLEQSDVLNERRAISETLETDQGQPLSPGVYYLGMDAEGVRHETRMLDARIVVVATANLTFKITQTESLLWLTDLNTGAPLSGVPVVVYDYDFIRLGTSVTDGKGLARMSLPAPKDPSMPRYAVAEQTSGGKQVFSLANSSWDSQLQLYDFGADVNYYIQPNAPKGYVYTDRPLYRPGQTVYYKGIVRLDDDLRYSLPSQPVVEVQINSFETTVFTGTLPISPTTGAFEGQLPLDMNAALGSYTINVKFPGQENYFFGSVWFSVAEYRKPEFLLTVNTSAKDIMAGDTFTTTVSADFYSGGAVANADVSWVLTAAPFTFTPSGEFANRGYDFFDFAQDAYYYYQTGDYSPRVIAQGNGKTDDKGKFKLSLPANLGDTSGSQTLTLEATIVDITGNAVSERASLVAHRSAFYPGIKSDSYVGTVGKPQSFSIVVVDWKSLPVASQPISVTVVERRWSSVMEEDTNGHLRWTSNVQDIPVESKADSQTDSKGRASVTFTPKAGGVYRARVSVRDSRGNLASASAYTWVAGPEYIPWRQSNERTFELVTDKKSYAPGDTAEILIASPFQGQAYALVTVERGHVTSQDVITLTTNSTVYNLPITPEMAPNTYVSVLIVKGATQAGGKTQPPAFKYSMVELAVDRQQQTLNVTITPDRAQVGPREQVTYTIRTADFQGKPVQADVSLSLVDLAVLSMSAPNTGPLLDYYYPHRAISVMTSVPLVWSIEDYNHLLQVTTPEGMGQGSGGGKGGGAYGVIDVRGNFQDTAYWKATVMTGADGTAKVTVTLPDNLTTWRMDARAVTKDTRVGQATNDIVSSKPLLLRPQAPRFFVANDRVWLSTAVHNNSEQVLTVDVSLEADGVELSDPIQQTITLPARTQQVVGWNAKVLPNVNRVDLVFSAQGGGFKDASRPTLGTLEGNGIPVYNFEVHETVGTAGSMGDAGVRTETINLPLFPQFQLSDAKLSVKIDPSLAAGMTEGLTYLESYPYECTEQTVSRFLPNVLTMRAYKAANLSDPALETKLNQLVDDALQRLYNQQHADGGWGWWSEDKSDDYVTAYVMLGLVEAKASGYTVSQDVFERGVNYLSYNLSSVRSLDEQYKLNRQAFMLYVLARAGSPAVSQTTQLYDARQSLSLYGKAFLAQAIYAIKQNDSRLQTIISDLVSQAGLSATGAHWNEANVDYWNWSTDTRSTAIILDTLIKIDPKNQLNENVVRWLMVNRTDGRWGSTQETAWSLMALTDWMIASGELKANYQFQAALNGQGIGSGSVNADNLRTTTEITVDIAKLLVGESNRLAIARDGGPGNLYYTAQLNVSLPVEQVQPLDRGIVVSRSYYNLDNLHQPIKEADQGEVFLAKITVVVPNDVHYLVVEDPLPAGVEAVDESLKTSQQTALPPELGWQTGDEMDGWGWWYFNHVELRDNRVVLSVDHLPAGTYEYTYRVRASTPGTYHVIPTTASEFYFPEVYGRGAGMLFEVRKP